MESSAVVASGWTSLSLELRQAIWELVYTTQDARVVEVSTAEHSHHSQEHDWCPRFSPSPRPTMVNICHEARCIAHDVAQRAGHLIFQGTQDTYASDIYFNPEIDTLFVRNDKYYWIRDWGSEGILTQMWKMHDPDRLRFLAIELEPLTRATTPWSLHIDLFYFPQVEEIMFVVKQESEEAQERLRFLNRERRHLVQDGSSGYTRPRPKVSQDLGDFKLARIRRGALEYLPSPMPATRRRHT
ncbi:hypothetical protein ONS95_012850 [Cadophora gregata]|uniref:uncharacterized protein n=1 Tax=Cadophora gregata TaxID=51156 RepID=UPI0026DD81A0|nr:uncharacterized protein ONS95_012850 [Cadophora gregata]KAK0101169.1 hypothetical protein ONS96_006391 [Cadophora gregata f. sp. sojae]KAK0115799.1 hypothetical protein ONS95_012850 [Cadophora gregata]